MSCWRKQLPDRRKALSLQNVPSSASHPALNIVLLVSDVNDCTRDHVALVERHQVHMVAFNRVNILLRPELADVDAVRFENIFNERPGPQADHLEWHHWRRVLGGTLVIAVPFSFD